MEALSSLSEAEALEILYDWRFWARENQLPPTGDWLTWVLLAGRGFGKTRTGAEDIRDRVQAGTARRIAFIARTPADVRDVMVEGDSGITTISPPWNMPVYVSQRRRITWPNGAYALVYSSYEPDALRGPQFDTAWCDELGAWKYPQETWDNLQFGLRRGDPKCIITTTPKPLKLLRQIIADPTTVTTRGSTYENAANLAPPFLRAILNRYEGTRTGRQEIYAELLDEAEGALWKRYLIGDTRVSSAPTLTRIVVAIDPAVSATEQSDETGIVAAGISENGHGYILEDGSGRYSPDGWASQAIRMYTRLLADRIIGEVNNGGDMIESTLRTVMVAGQPVGQSIPYTAVHASRGKAARAEPIAALYEQGKIHHVGAFNELEDQLCTWEPNSGDRSPDRLDALVWALTELMLGGIPNVRWL